MRSQSRTISVIMAFYNPGCYLADAIASVQAQTHDAIELILSDDGSDDGSREWAEIAASRDARLRVVTGPQGGPSAARNRAIDVASGDWIAVVDADDLLHPARFARLLARAEALGADMVADDLVHFGAESGRSLLQPLDLQAPWWVDARSLLAAETRTPPVSLGYLKPLVRRAVIGDLRYRPTLRVGEDFDFLLRLSLAGATLAVLPDAYYLYRRHGASISHRLSAAAAHEMIAALDDLAAPGLVDLIAERRAGLAREAAFAEVVAALKACAPGQVMAQIARRPALMAALLRAFLDGRGRRREMPAPSGSLRLSAAPDATLSLPEAAEDWQLKDVLAVVAAGNDGAARIQSAGRVGFEALGYIPGWSMAELTPPAEGWSDAERRTIAALPWPVSAD